MKLHYYPETDSLYIELKTAPGVEAREVVEGLVVDLDANGEVVGFDLDHASGSWTCRRSRQLRFLQRALRNDKGWGDLPRSGPLAAVFRVLVGRI